MASIGPCVMETLALIENGKLCWITQRKRRAANREREREKERGERVDLVMWLARWPRLLTHNNSKCGGCIIIIIILIILVILRQHRHIVHTHTQKQKCFVSLLNEQQTDRSVIINRGNHLEQIGTILCYNIILQEDKYVCGFIIYIYVH